MRIGAISRRRAMAGFGSFVAGSTLLNSQSAVKLSGEAPGRTAPMGELINALEFEPMAQLKLNWTAYHEIAGGDRRAFDRITYRPRIMVNTEEMDLTTELFGQKMFCPIIAGPISEQARFHPEAELATIRGCADAKSVAIISSRSSVPAEKIAAEAKTALWYQVFPEADLNTLKSRIGKAMQAGFKALCITVGAPYNPAISMPPAPSHLQALGGPATDWKAIDTLRQGVNAPVLLKGIMRPEDAAEAVKRGIQGIVVSNYGGQLLNGEADPISVLPGIADAIAGKIPILSDGSIRRGSDVVKSLALGARAVLLGRPVMWGLAAYGSGGVQSVIELIQTEMAKDMAMCGKSSVQLLNRDVVKLHRW